MQNYSVLMSVYHKESAKDIVLFDKTYAHPVGDIKDFII